MSSIAFDDYYEDLQISSNADSETIERVYRLLAKRYHPDNAETGNTAIFEMINQAHQVLSIPEKRAAYDVTYETKKFEQWRSIAEISSPKAHDGDTYSRRSLLSILYVKCRENPSDPGVGLWRLEKMLGWPENLIEFHFWYLKEKGHLRRNDNGELEITVTGVDLIEEEGLVTGKDLLLPESTQKNQEVKMINEEPEEPSDHIKDSQ